MKKILSLILALCLLVGCLPMAAGAMEGTRVATLPAQEVNTFTPTESGWYEFYTVTNEPYGYGYDLTVSGPGEARVEEFVIQAGEPISPADACTTLAKLTAGSTYTVTTSLTSEELGYQTVSVSKIVPVVVPSSGEIQTSFDGKYALLSYTPAKSGWYTIGNDSDDIWIDYSSLFARDRRDSVYGREFFAAGQPNYFVCMASSYSMWNEPLPSGVLEGTIAPAEIKKLTTSSPVTATSGNDGAAERWASFTAPSAGNYTFTLSRNHTDANGCQYMAVYEENSPIPWWTIPTPSRGYMGFSITLTLEAGKTYLIHPFSLYDLWSLSVRRVGAAQQVPAFEDPNPREVPYGSDFGAIDNQHWRNGINPAYNTAKDGGAITYKSSNPAVAVVDANTGKVTAGGSAGTAVITATAAAVAGKYAEASASYNIVVEKADIASADLTDQTKTIKASDPNNTAAGLIRAMNLPSQTTVTYNEDWSGEGKTATLPVTWTGPAEKYNARGGTYTFQAAIPATTNFNAYAPSATATLTVTPVNGTVAAPLATPVLIARSAAQNAASYADFKLPTSVTINCDNGVAAQTITPEWSVPLSALKSKPINSKTNVKITNVPEWLTIDDSAITVQVQITDKFPVNVSVTQSGTTYGTALSDPAAAQSAIDNGTDLSGTYTYRYTGTTAAGKKYNSTEKPTDAGTYTVTATLVSSTHVGSGSAEFTIAPKALTAAMVAAIPDEAYNSAPHTPEPVVTDTAALKKGTDYDVTYQDNVNAGTATAVITGKGNYTGTVNQNFTIQPKDISTGKAAITGTAEVDYALLASISGVDSTDDFTYSWYVDGTKVDGNRIYLFLKEEYKDKAITVTATADSGNYTGTTAASEPVTVTEAGEEIVSSAVPGKPEITANAGNGQISVTAAAESEKPVGLYEIRLYDTAGSALKTYFTTDSTYTVSGLKNGTGYQASVVAYNINGGSGESDKISVTPKAPAPSIPSDPEPVVETITTETGSVATITTQANGDREIEVKTASGETFARIELPADPGTGKSFVDVKEGDWFKSAVDNATAYGLFQGTSDITFSPNGSMTRGMLAQTLWNLSGKTSYGKGEGTFTDVKDGTWYENAIDWAAKVEIVSGTGGGKYAPEHSVTREQIVTMLYRYAQTICADTKGSAGLESFPDSGEVSGFAREAVAWAVAEGLLTGRSSGGINYIAPQGTATRSEVAAILTRFVEFLK
ncbi:S-layer homology domain-containing protein [uncultured Neglectibacter sp.]|uniref:S-layer homology domain-containing protein n=1 Tax=uncultured Neglectibacter sp. TaxID=1924108 RepID=UPI0034DFA3B0